MTCLSFIDTANCVVCISRSGVAIHYSDIVIIIAEKCDSM